MEGFPIEFVEVRIIEIPQTVCKTISPALDMHPLEPDPGTNRESSGIFRVDNRDRTGSIPAWQAGAPPFMRHRPIEQKTGFEPAP